MDSDRLAAYPWVIVRMACRRCNRSGAYRLARLAAKHGPEAAMPDVIAALSADCSWRDGKRHKGQHVECGAYLPDLERPLPPDLPPALSRLRVIRGGRG